MSGAENKSYQQRSAANSRYHKIYTALLAGLQLSNDHMLELRRRGLNDEQLKESDYKTKPDNRNVQLQQTVANLDKEFDLSGVPGFYLNEKTGRRAIVNTAGILIPIRDINYQIQSILIKPDVPKIGRKYELLSTPKSTQGGGARNTTHFPVTHNFESKEQIGTTLRITEGILKADVTCALDPSMLTLGIPGLNAPDDLSWVLQQLEISKIILAFDQEKAVDVHDRRQKLYLSLKDDYEVTFEVWNESQKGIDDALLNAPDSIRQLPKEEINDYLSLIESPAKNWVYVIRMEEFYCLPYDDHLSKSQFMTKMRLPSMEIVNQMLAGAAGHEPFPCLDEVEFYPTQQQIFKQDEKTYFNLWRPNSVEPIEGDVTPFIAHMEYLFPEANERKHLLQWIAHQVQFPGAKIHFAALIQGMPGIGKSFIGYLMDILLGKRNVARPSNEDVHERYSSWEKNCQLVVVEEVMAEGKIALMNKLKPKITEPITSVREMHKASYEQPNRYNMMLLTNYKNSLPIASDDRRYMVLFSPAHPQSPEYYKKLFAWSQIQESASALLYWAQNYDLADFEAKGHAPKTGGRAEMVDHSKLPFEQYVETCLEERQWPFNSDIVSVHDIANSNNLPPRFKGNGTKRWTTLLEAFGAQSLGQIEIIAGGPKRHVWAVRRAEFWKLQDIKDKRHEYERWNGGQPGGNPTDDVLLPMSA